MTEQAPRLFPRLPLGAAQQLSEAMCTSAPEDLSDQVAISHDHAYFAPTGGTIVSPADLEAVRQVVVGGVEEIKVQKIPDTVKRSIFDETVARILHRELRIAPGEASRAEVWSFLACVLLPDVARWRFPVTRDPARFLGGIRNTVQRLWWRAFILYEPSARDPYELLKNLSEDQMVAIMERPSLRASPAVAKALGKALVGLRERLPTGEIERVSRLAVKQVRQLYPVVAFDSLSPSELARLIRGVFARATASNGS